MIMGRSTWAEVAHQRCSGDRVAECAICADRGARMPRSEADLRAAVFIDVSLDGVRRDVAIDLHPCGTDEMLVLRCVRASARIGRCRLA